VHAHAGRKRVGNPDDVADEDPDRDGDDERLDARNRARDEMGENAPATSSASPGTYGLTAARRRIRRRR